MENFTPNSAEDEAMATGLEEKAKIKTLAINQNDHRQNANKAHAAGVNMEVGGLAGLWCNRHILRMMVQRDSLGKYKGSLLGMLWPLINPLGHLLLYTFLFCLVLNVKFNETGGVGNFALYLMTGLLPWGAFSEALSRSSTIVLEYPNFVKRVVFPLPILPLVTVLSPLVTETMAFTMLIAAVVVTTQKLHATVAYLPLIAFSQLLLTAGITWVLASLGVYIRDIKHMMALALAAWMYATPIVYPASRLPSQFQFLLWINPMAGIITDYRRVVLEGLPPDWSHYACYTTLGVIVFYLGFKFFDKTKKSFADVM
ncbi:MAG: ABC transporter permease [Candidatus Melainabacteria bacterium]|nr:ABC transporter permease [Candidatus Melainabacteria bacterium]